MSRINVLGEIITSEEVYIADLKTVKKCYLTPLSSEHSLPPSTISIITSKIDTFIKVNSLLLEQLKANCPLNSKEQDVVVGGVFLSMADYLKVYSGYSSCQVSTLSTISQVAHKKVELYTFLKTTQESEECRKLDLGSFLIKPIQRLCKYPQLLEQLLKHTEPSHRDYVPLQQALAKVQSVATHVDKSQKKEQNISKMAEIQSRLIPTSNPAFSITIVKPARKFLIEGTFLLLEKTKLHNSSPQIAPSSPFKSPHIGRSGMTASNGLNPSLTDSPTSSPRTRRASRHSRGWKRSLMLKRLPLYNLFLFNDILLCTKDSSKPTSSTSESKVSHSGIFDDFTFSSPASSSLRLKAIFDLFDDQTLVRDYSETYDYDDDSNRRHVIEIVQKNRESQKWILATSDFKIKQKWLDLFKKKRVKVEKVILSSSDSEGELKPTSILTGLKQDGTVLYNGKVVDEISDVTILQDGLKETIKEIDSLRRVHVKLEKKRKKNRKNRNSGGSQIVMGGQQEYSPEAKKHSRSRGTSFSGWHPNNKNLDKNGRPTSATLVIKKQETPVEQQPTLEGSGRSVSLRARSNSLSTSRSAEGGFFRNWTNKINSGNTMSDLESRYKQLGRAHRASFSGASSPSSDGIKEEEKSEGEISEEEKQLLEVRKAKMKKLKVVSLEDMEKYRQDEKRKERVRLVEEKTRKLLELEKKREELRKMLDSGKLAITDINEETSDDSTQIYL